jgi:hypothetical protein
MLINVSERLAPPLALQPPVPELDGVLAATELWLIRSVRPQATVASRTDSAILEQEQAVVFRIGVMVP